MTEFPWEESENPIYTVALKAARYRDGEWGLIPSPGEGKCIQLLEIRDGIIFYTIVDAPTSIS